MSKDYNLLHVLLVLAEERQTVLAAKKLNLSQPTISVMLRKLREQFDDPLFVRDKNTLEPTPKCEKILQTLPRVLDQLDSLYLENTQWDIEAEEEEIELYFAPPLLTLLGVPLLKRLSELAPKLTVQCQQWDRDTTIKLDSHRRSWGVTYLPMETNKNLVQRDLGADRFGLLMRADHPLQSNEIQEIIEYPIGICAIPGSNAASQAEKVLQEQKIEKSINARVSDLSLLHQLLKQSDYLCILPERVLTVLGDDYRFMPFPQAIIPSHHRRPIALFTHQRHRRHPLTEWLESLFKEVLDEQGQ
ncbi:TPA: LysR family transcriptional regulator [Vibrio vulnificus]|uniref:LysR family transcriptional regulator n=1 Tax=Vibrio vulnificus TaxID=672 RepID=A0A8H9N3G0_VIBVL|nr:LysR family transcriptional regulator [Vibrio vulnificus]EGR0231029.1 LysR family transcriptional regulator [Vibrio vulnificus]EJV9421426.1 LysR family transcriptional regulator [Vibrio vulnificus]ELI0347476.1 LysR family transcriptional regulator [Vibrio vulnificus]ELK2035951.1 LysR family transcriptional regulator [Vibrio vulnificus]ELK2281730.1 LysR family transcriptional regulator [Vibrio vulnificus]